MTAEQLDRLKELAERATPGPWNILHFDTSYVIRSSVERNISSATGEGKSICSLTKRSQKSSDAEYIAAVSPDVVLGLIDAARNKSAWHGLVEGSEMLCNENTALRAEHDKLIAEVTRLTKLAQAEYDERGRMQVEINTEHEELCHLKSVFHTVFREEGKLG